MLALHSLVLQAPEVFYATAQSNCKTAGSSGSRWHSHGGMPHFNDCRVRSPSEYLAEGCMDLMLAYPAGFEEDETGGGEEAGNINIIKGAHLYCDTAAESPSTVSGKGSEVNDRAMEQGWLQGKCHPVTGEPLVCERVSLPPGSLICCNTHSPHRVSPTAAKFNPRLAMSLFASKAETATGFVQPASTLPPLWALKAIRGELPPTLARFFANGTDRALTGGARASTESSTGSNGGSSELVHTGAGTVPVNGQNSEALLTHANPRVREAARARLGA